MEGFGKGQRWWSTGGISGTSFVAQEDELEEQGRAPQGILRGAMHARISAETMSWETGYCLLTPKVGQGV